MAVQKSETFEQAGDRIVAEVNAAKAAMPRTRFERITENPKTLAGLLCKNFACAYCPARDFCRTQSILNCEDTLKAWLGETI